MDLLEAAGTPVPSLRSKLNGETRLRQVDAVALLDTYFSHWSFEASDDGDQLGYLRLDSTNLKQAQRAIIHSLFGKQDSILLPNRRKTQRTSYKNVEEEHSDTAMFLAGSDFLIENFRSSKSIITVSRIGSVAGPTTSTAIRRFCQIIDDYWKADLDDNADRYLIWIVDPGDRDITNDESLAAFSNAEQLATFLRSVRLLSDSVADARWQWLSTHSVVIFGSMDRTVTDRIYSSVFREA